MSTATVVAKGILSQYQGVNYLLIREFQVVNEKKPEGDPKKAAAPATDKDAVKALAEEGVAARYERKDLPAAEKAWEKALPLLDQPDVDATHRYQVLAGLGLIHGQRREYAKSRDYFKKAVAASDPIDDNRKPLAYSYYNLSCAEALLGETEAALASLKLALKTELDTPRRVYVKMAGGDSSFAKLKDDPRFKALLKEYAEWGGAPK